MQCEINRLCELDNWHWALMLLQDYAILAVGVASPYTVAALAGGSSTAWWLQYAVAVVLIAARQRALADILHTSTHRTLARSPIINRLGGTIFSGYLVFQGWHAYWRSHVVGHHGQFGHPKLDPDLRFYLEEGLYEPRSRRAFVLLYVVGPLLFSKTLPKLKDLIQNRLVLPNEPRHETVAKNAFMLGTGLLLVGLGFGKALLLFWLVPCYWSFRPSIGSLNCLSITPA